MAPSPIIGAGRPQCSQKSDQPPEHQEDSVGLGSCLASATGGNKGGRFCPTEKAVRCHSAQRPSSPTASGQPVGTPHQTAV